jgi:thioester reductase-like protein
VGKLKSKQDASRIGQPLSCRVWITDPNDRDILNPIGVPGELLIEGPLVARGYLNNPSLTEKSFILDPSFIGQYGFSPGRRMYCTGDLVQQDTDGALRYLGRKDAQMKINGQRVDPGEIEYWAKAFSEDVKKSSVTLIHPRGDATRTILGLALEIPISRFDMAAKGILPLSEDLRVLLEGVRSLLLDKVPAYMVPSLYVPVGEIPQTSSSKVDRRALCTMLETLDSKQLSEYALANTLKEAASTPMEKRLQKLWAASLGASTAYFGVKDDFFVVGGDSLAAMKLVGHCRKDQIPLTVVDIFKHPRLDHMAELAEKKRSDVIQPSKDQTDEAFSLYPGIDNTRMAEIAAECDVTISQIEDVYPCSPLQEGLFTVTLRQPHAYMYRQVFRLNSIDVGQFQEAWQKVAQEVPIVRTVIVPDDTHQFLQVVLRRPLVWVTGICLDTYLEADKKIANQPGRALSRYAIISEGEQRYFVWTAHHSCYDGITLRKLFELVSQVYLGVQPKIPLPFKTFVNHLRAQEYGQATEFWRSQLQGGALSFPDLPHPKQEVRVTVRLFHRIPIPRGPLTVTLSNLLRAAWAIVISAATKRETVLFGATLSGRTAAVAGITDIAGPTITTVPIQIRINHHVAISNFLDEVQKQAIDMMPFEHTGLQYIRRLVSPTSNLPDLGNLFVVQFPQEQDELLAGFMPGLMPHAVASQEFDSYPLNVFCNLNTGESHNVNVEARFDSRAISTAAVKRLLEQFGLVIERLTTMPAKTRLGDIDVVSLKNISASGNGLDGSQGVPVNVEHQAVVPRYRSSGSQLEKDMQAICSDVLGLAIEDDTSLYRSFGNLGGDSFMAMQLVMRCRRKGITISVQDIIRSKSIGDLVSNIERLQHGSARKGARLVVEESVDWHAEAALGQVPESSRPTRGSQLEVILTGSTGFLGRHILEQLLASPNVSRVHCLAVRSQGLGSGRNEPPTSPKVITYSGDLTLPLLGLSGDQCELFASCSAIIHCGAQVSFVQPYQALQKANVESTKTLAHFAMKYGIPFHFISTLGVTHLSRQETFGEVSVSSYQPTNSANGYVASKWVSEVFLENANRETGLPVYIYRPSSIVGPGAPTLDIANNLVNFSRKMKVIPNFAAWNGHLDCVHINAVAANISGTVLQHQSQSGPGSVVYLHESGQLVLPYSGIKEYLESEGSTTLREVSLREWVSLALAQGLHTSVAEFLESSAENVTKEHMMPLCQTSRDYSAYGRVRL